MTFANRDDATRINDNGEVYPMAKAKKQQTAPKTEGPQVVVKPAAAPAVRASPSATSAPPASKAAARPTDAPPAPRPPAAIEPPTKAPAERTIKPPVEAKSTKKTPARQAGPAPAANVQKPAEKPAQKPATAGAPIIDTRLAAAAAASMVAHRDPSAGGAPANGAASDQSDSGRQESASFKQLKQGLNKPAASVGNLLGTPPGQKKSNLPFGGPKQSFRNQTFGADVNRSGVPRRTGG
jgi:hypothetical protein